MIDERRAFRQSTFSADRTRCSVFNHHHRPFTKHTLSFYLARPPWNLSHSQTRNLPFTFLPYFGVPVCDLALTGGESVRSTPTGTTSHVHLLSSSTITAAPVYAQLIFTPEADIIVGHRLLSSYVSADACTHQRIHRLHRLVSAANAPRLISINQIPCVQVQSCSYTFLIAPCEIHEYFSRNISKIIIS